jgi:hypothetical protein
VTLARMETLCLPAAVAPAGHSLSGLIPCRIPAASVALNPKGQSSQRPSGDAGSVAHKAAVAELSFSAGALNVTYEPLSWEQWCAVRAGEADVGPGAAWPAIASAHVLVVTSDSRLLLTRRAETSSFFPGAWSASIEEGIEHPLDRTLGDTVERGVAEELGARPPEAVTLLGVAREHDPASGAPWGVVFLTLAQLQVTADALLVSRQSAADASEHTEAVTVPLASAPVAAPPGGGRWHPTAAARLGLLGTYLAGSSRERTVRVPQASTGPQRTAGGGRRG